MEADQHNLLIGPRKGKCRPLSPGVEAFMNCGYTVAMLARNEERLAATCEQAHTFPSDVLDTAKLNGTVAYIRTHLGVPSIVIHNTVGGTFGEFMEIEPETLDPSFQVNTWRCYICPASLPMT